MTYLPLLFIQGKVISVPPAIQTFSFAKKRVSHLFFPLLVLAIFAFAPGKSFAASSQVNGKLAFSRDSQAIFTVNPDTTGLGQIVIQGTVQGLVQSDPEWSPDGLELALTLNDSLVRVNQDGNIKKVLTSGNYSSSPTWMPDGQHILFTDGIDRDQLNVIGVNPANLDEGKDFVSANTTSASIANDGKRVALLQGGEIYIADLEANFQITNLRKLDQATQMGTRIVKMSLSPEGEKVAFSACGNAVEGLTGCYLYLINSDGSALSLQRLLQIPGTSYQYDPVWSPDGKKIAFAWDRRSRVVKEDADIYTVNVDRTGLTQVTSGTQNDRSPSWQAVPTATTPPVDPPSTVPSGPAVDTNAPNTSTSTTSSSTTQNNIASTKAVSLELNNQSIKLMRVKNRLLLRFQGKIFPADVAKEVQFQLQSLGKGKTVKQQGKLVVKNGAFSLKNYKLNRSFKSTGKVKLTVFYRDEKSKDKAASAQVSKTLQVRSRKR